MKLRAKQTNKQKNKKTKNKKQNDFLEFTISNMDKLTNTHPNIETIEIIITISKILILIILKA